MDRGGIVTDRTVRTSRDLAECLRSGDYQLIAIDLSVGMKRFGRNVPNLFFASKSGFFKESYLPF